jgi:hypothetical protein
MKLRLLKIALVQLITAAIIIVVIFFAYTSYISSRAKLKAQSVCNSIPIGMAAKDAEKIAFKSAEHHLLFTSNAQISVGFRGALMERWFCDLELKQEKVAGHEIRLID